MEHLGGQLQFHSILSIMPRRPSKPQSPGQLYHLVAVKLWPFSIALKTQNPCKINSLGEEGNIQSVQDKISENVSQQKWTTLHLVKDWQVISGGCAFLSVPSDFSFSHAVRVSHGRTSGSLGTNPACVHTTAIFLRKEHSEEVGQELGAVLHGHQDPLFPS